MLTKAFSDFLGAHLSTTTECDLELTGAIPLGGGSINNAYKVTTTQGNFFVKFNDVRRFPGMFETEAMGLELIRSTSSIGVPEFITKGAFENYSFLVLEYVEPGKRVAGYSRMMGQQLAALHRNTSAYFGLDHENYIGSLPQINTPLVSGLNFLVTYRLEPLVTSARNKKLLSTDDVLLFQQCYRRLPELLPGESPALLHGDLWNGNVITGNDGSAMVIDPAVYYGYRETDLAMARLFGGFDAAFFDGYQESYPLADGWEYRVELFQLYPLLVHLNLFGSGYREGLMASLRKYV